MKKLIVISMVLGLMVTSALAMPSVVVTRTDGYFDAVTHYGEYTLTPSSDLSFVLSSYDSKALVNNPRLGLSFESFCLETQEHSASVEYVQFNSKAINGGVGPQGDPISIGTAYLYHEFQKGTLQGYDYTPGPGRGDDAEALAGAIWTLEEENVGQHTFDPKFLTLVDSIYANPKEDNNGRIPVAVLNGWTYDPAGGVVLRQDYLVCVPAPGAILLGSIGVSIVGWLRRRRTL